MNPRFSKNRGTLKIGFGSPAQVSMNPRFSKNRGLEDVEQVGIETLVSMNPRFSKNRGVRLGDRANGQ